MVAGKVKMAMGIQKSSPATPVPKTASKTSGKSQTLPSPSSAKSTLNQAECSTSSSATIGENGVCSFVRCLLPSLISTGAAQAAGRGGAPPCSGGSPGAGVEVEDRAFGA
ncbi:unnamed protein product [Rhodiola kirilowii]